MKTPNKLLGFGLVSGLSALLAQTDCNGTSTTTYDLATPQPDLGMPAPDLAPVAPALTVTAVAPSSAANNVNVPVTITGTGFRSGDRVTVGGLLCDSVNVVSSTSITCVISARLGTCGAQDIVVTHPDDSKSATGAKLFTQRSALIDFTPATSQAAGGGPATVLALDVNKDGKLDLVNSNNKGYIQVHLGNGDGTFMAAVSVNASGTLLDMVAVDLNKDNNLDLVATVATTGMVDVFDGNGQGFAAPRSFSTTGTFPYGLTTADVNNDGNPDILAAHLSSGNVGVLLGNGTGGLTAAAAVSVGTNPVFVSVGDLNGDKKLDFVTGSTTTNNVSLVLGNGDGTFGTATPFAAGSSSLRPLLAEVTGDTFLDLIVSRIGARDTAVFAGKGDGTFDTAPLGQTAVGAGQVNILLIDLDADGKRDLILNNTTASTFNVSRALGNGLFAEPQTFPAGSMPFGAASGDFNGDGLTDLAVTNSADGSDLSLFAGKCR